MVKKRVNPELAKLKKDLNRKGFFIRLPSLPSIETEIKLWRSVLDRALLDLLEVETQSEIICWLCNDYAETEQDNKGSFEDVCELAFLPKDFVYKKFLDVLFKVERNWDGRVFRR